MNWDEPYRRMSLSRAFELASAELWAMGRISGELHLGTGEEVVAAAAVTALHTEDAVACDHRCSPPFVMRGVSPTALFAELLGRPNGLCRGWGGHMHLFHDDPLTVSSGIVGSAGPTAAGFALAARRLRTGSVAVGFFGDGAANQGMLMEALNLAVAWRLPVVFVCKNNEWAITTRSAEVTGGSLEERFASFGLRTFVTDGSRLTKCHAVMSDAIQGARRGNPAAVLASVPRLHGHMLGYKAARIADHPTSAEARAQVQQSLASLSGQGGSLLARSAALFTQLRTLGRSRGEAPGGRDDPLERARRDAAREGVDVSRIDQESVERIDDALTELGVSR